MPDPALRDRLAQIIEAALHRAASGATLDEIARSAADALLASEEWDVRREEPA